MYTHLFILFFFLPTQHASVLWCKNRLMLSKMASWIRSKTDSWSTWFQILLQRANSSSASTPDGSSPDTMSEPGHFLSGGLVLIKAWASRNAHSPPSLLHHHSFFVSSPFTPPLPTEAKKCTCHSLPCSPPLRYVPLVSHFVLPLSSACDTLHSGFIYVGIYHHSRYHLVRNVGPANRQEMVRKLKEVFLYP